MIDQEKTARFQPLWDFLSVSEPPVSADAIFVLGSQDLRVPARAAELFHQGHASRILVTGSYGRMTRHLFPQPEALVFKQHLLAAGVPKSAIVTEPDASNTLENVQLGMRALELAGLSPRTLLLVGKGFVMRRSVATFARHFGAVSVVPCPPKGGLEMAMDRDASAFVARLVAEVERLEQYADQGDIRRDPIPPAIKRIVATFTPGALSPNP